MEEITIGGRYRHFKGKEYRVLALARHSETMEEFIVYQALYGSEEFGPNAVWIRPRAMFLEKIDRGEGEILRFAPIPD